MRKIRYDPTKSHLGIFIERDIDGIYLHKYTFNMYDMYEDYDWYIMLTYSFWIKKDDLLALFKVIDSTEAINTIYFTDPDIFNTDGKFTEPFEKMKHRLINELLKRGISLTPYDIFGK